MSNRWRFDIKYGPEGEANYAWVYDSKNELVAPMKIHHAAAVVEAMNAYEIIVRSGPIWGEPEHERRRMINHIAELESTLAALRERTDNDAG